MLYSKTQKVRRASDRLQNLAPLPLLLLLLLLLPCTGACIAAGLSALH
jgi:hypothetical protein